jgi:hypothetical protein
MSLMETIYQSSGIILFQHVFYVKLNTGRAPSSSGASRLGNKFEIIGILLVFLKYYFKRGSWNFKFIKRVRI